MSVLANLPALLLVLNLAGDPGEETPRGSVVQPTERETRDVGFARLHMNRDIRFVISDNRTRETLERLEAAGRPASARGLPKRLEPRRSSVLPIEVCGKLRCPSRR